jgi:imidazole glycerol-phosphate synthase subunit HisF
MIRKRVITVLTINNGILFRTRNFNPDHRYTLNFVDAWSVDEIVLLDITRPGQGNRDNFYNIVSAIARDCFVPLTVGGGIKSIEDIQKLLELGADKITINYLAADNFSNITKISERYGSQCVVVSMDCIRDGNEGNYRVMKEFGQVPVDLSVEQYAMEAARHGAGEILLQAIHKDGTLEGLDCELSAQVASTVDIPVLLCGGAGAWPHFEQAFVSGNASGVCTTQIYHFTESSIKSAKSYLNKAGISVRQ